jgi:hypothetical protein
VFLLDSSIVHGPALFCHTDATELRKCGPYRFSTKPRVAGELPITILLIIIDSFIPREVKIVVSQGFSHCHCRQHVTEEAAIGLRPRAFRFIIGDDIAYGCFVTL